MSMQYSIINKCVNKYRIVFLKVLGSKIGKNVKAYGSFTVLKHENLEIGDNCTINEGVHINCRNKVIIGKSVRLSTNTQIHTGKLNLNTDPRIHTSEAIIIKDNVWIASGVIISAGVTINENSVIGANSVIINDVEENSFYAGNPAKKIKDL